MNLSDITKVTITVEADGSPCVVRIPEEDKAVLLEFISRLSPGNTLQLVKLPSDCKFESVKTFLS